MNKHGNENYLPKHSSSGPALNPGGQMSFFTVEAVGSDVISGPPSVNGLPGLPPHL